MKHTTTFPGSRLAIACAGALALAIGACGGGAADLADTSAALSDRVPADAEAALPSPADLVTQDEIDVALSGRSPARDGAITAESLHGYWVNTAGYSSLFVDFRTDGTFTIGGSGRLRSGAFTSGTFEAVDETIISFRTAEDASECPGVTMTWTGVTNEHGVMTVEALAPDCEIPVPTPWEWTRVSPVSTAGLSLQAGDLDVELVAAADISEIQGLWLRIGTGDVLALDPSGTYLLASDGDSLNPLDSGSYVIVSPGVLAFTSDGSAECDAGEGWTWRGVTTAKDLLRENQARGFSMRADSSELCGAPNEAGSWRLLSPEKS